MVKIGIFDNYGDAGGALVPDSVSIISGLSHGIKENNLNIGDLTYTPSSENNG